MAINHGPNATGTEHDRIPTAHEIAERYAAHPLASLETLQIF